MAKSKKSKKQVVKKSPMITEDNINALPGNVTAASTPPLSENVNTDAFPRMDGTSSPVVPQTPVTPEVVTPKVETESSLMEQLRKELDDVRIMKQQLAGQAAKLEEKIDEKLFLISGITAKEENAHKTKKQLMKEHLDKQVKVSVFVPLDGGEKVGTAFKTVTLNGYRYEVPKGIYIDVPKQVADIIKDSLNQAATALESNLRLDNAGVSDEKIKALS